MFTSHILCDLKKKKHEEALNKPDLRESRLKVVSLPSEVVEIIDLVDIMVSQP